MRIGRSGAHRAERSATVAPRVASGAGGHLCGVAAKHDPLGARDGAEDVQAELGRVCVAVVAGDEEVLGPGG